MSLAKAESDWESSMAFFFATHNDISKKENLQKLYFSWDWAREKKPDLISALQLWARHAKLTVKAVNELTRRLANDDDDVGVTSDH